MSPAVSFEEGESLSEENTEDQTPVTETDSTPVEEAITTSASFTEIVAQGTMTNIVLNSGVVKPQNLTNADKELDQVISTSSLISQWRFNEASLMDSMSAVDSGASSNYSALLISDDSGVEKITTSGFLDNSIELDGTGDYLNVTYNSALNPGGAISVSAWVKVNSGGYASDNGIVCLGPTDWNLGSYLLAVDDSNALSFRVGTENGIGRVDLGSPLIGEWMHLVGTYDGTEVRLYQNGELLGIDAHTGTIRTASDDLKIGKRCGTDNRYFNGSIDEVSIFNAAMSGTDVETLYKKQVGQYNTSLIFEFVSPTIKTDASFTKITAQTSSPYGKPLVATGNEQTVYSSLGIDTTGLVSLWYLDEANVVDTTVINDAVVLSNNSGAYNDSVSTDKATVGKFNGAISFDGVDDGITIPDSTSLSITSDTISYSAWINMDNNAQSAASRVLSKSNAGTSDVFAMRISSDHTVSCRLTNDSSSSVTIYSSRIVTLNKWYHLTCVYDGTQIKVYINGRLEGSGAQSGNLLDNSDAVTIGTHGTSPGNRRFSGKIDEVSLWSRALSENEVQALYARGVTNLRYQVKFCNQADCADASFVGPNGTDSTYFSELTNSDASFPLFDLSSLGSEKTYFQYKVLLSTEDSKIAPEFKGLLYSN